MGKLITGQNPTHAPASFDFKWIFLLTQMKKLTLLIQGKRWGDFCKGLQTDIPGVVRFLNHTHLPVVLSY